MVCCAFLFTAITCFAQGPDADTLSRQAMIDDIVDSFNKNIGDQSHLYNGPEYTFYDPAIKGNAYYKDDANFLTGRVEYDGFVYKDVSLLYDLNKDVLVLQLPSKVIKLALIKDRVQNFDMDNHHFVNINADTISKPGSIPSGFYDRLYNGKIDMLVRREKNIQSTSNAENYFNASTNIYIKKGGIYTKVSGKGDVLDVLKDKKDALKKYIRSNNIKFGDDEELATVRVVSYYDQLTQ
ncbi:hypothetical protein FFF34_013535 [Inquilinus sp. KBS0705]|nr:hypothetical protein FFF34_013535 [Inquilinus sp. KBS0705]